MLLATMFGCPRSLSYLEKLNARNNIPVGKYPGICSGLRVRFIGNMPQCEDAAYCFSRLANLLDSSPTYISGIREKIEGATTPRLFAGLASRRVGYMQYTTRSSSLEMVYIFAYNFTSRDSGIGAQ